MAEASVRALAAALREAYPPVAALDLRVGRCSIRVRSSSAELIVDLRRYFNRFLGRGRPPDVVVDAIDAPPPELDLPFRDWEREPGKRPRKEAIVDLPDGRIVRKVRTGMHFLVDGDVRLAVGPCRAWMNQLTNFVNFQYVAWLLERGWLLCHAAGVVHEKRGLAIAGVSAGGKSTLALHLLRHGLSFTSNDRLLLSFRSGAVWMSGIPKLPRVNPGTALRNPALRSLIPRERLAELERLRPEALWNLEEKYDVDVLERFGEDRWVLEAPLAGLIVLRWRAGSPAPAQMRRTTLDRQPELLATVVKPPGPFWTGGRSDRALAAPEESYLRCLRGVPVIEASGGVDFDAAVDAALEVVGARGAAA